MRQEPPPRPATTTVSSDLGEIPDRRQSPRRRLRDRIASLESTRNPGLRARPALRNLIMLADDDLRQTALALGGVEAFLGESLELLELPGVGAASLQAHAIDDDVLARLESLAENLANLRRRMLSIAAAMK